MDEAGGANHPSLTNPRENLIKGKKDKKLGDNELTQNHSGKIANSQNSPRVENFGGGKATWTNRKWVKSTHWEGFKKR